MRILVLRGGALGDFLITLPALRLLRETWPTARIELVGNARAAELAILSGELDAAHSQHEARWSALFDENALPREFAMWLDGFDLIISFWPDVDGSLRRHFARRGRAFIGSHARPTTRPAAKHFCDALVSLGIRTTEFRGRLNLPASAQAEAERRLGGFADFVAIHPGSGSPSKNWPLDRWPEFCRRLKRPILVISGEAERLELSGLDDVFVQNAREWPLPVLAAALTRASRYIGHDTGVSHLAAAVGANCLLLFGPTDSEIWAPPGENVKMIRRGTTMDAISVKDALAAYQES